MSVPTLPTAMSLSLLVKNFAQERSTDEGVYELLFAIKSMNTSHFLLKPNETLQLWAEEFGDDILFFIMDMTHECFTLLGARFATLNASLIVPMADNYSCFNTDRNVPESMSGQLSPSEGYLTDLFTNSRWVMLVLLLKTQTISYDLD